MKSALFTFSIYLWQMLTTPYFYHVASEERTAQKPAELWQEWHFHFSKEFAISKQFSYPSRSKSYHFKIQRRLQLYQTKILSQARYWQILFWQKSKYFIWLNFSVEYKTGIWNKALVWKEKYFVRKCKSWASQKVLQQHMPPLLPKQKFHKIKNLSKHLHMIKNVPPNKISKILSINTYIFLIPEGRFSDQTVPDIPLLEIRDKRPF